MKFSSENMLISLLKSIQFLKNGSMIFLIFIYNLLSAFGFTSLKDCADKDSN